MKWKIFKDFCKILKSTEDKLQPASPLFALAGKMNEKKIANQKEADAL